MEIFRHALVCNLHLLQLLQRRRNIALNDAPQRIVINTQVAMDQPVSRGDHQSPRDLRIFTANRIRDIRCRLADQFQIAHCGIVIQPAGDKARLVESIGIGNDLLGKADHVVKIETPFAHRSVRHARPPSL